MKRNTRLFGTVVLIVMLAMVTVIPAFAGEKEPPQKALTFRAHLSGAQEVPPVDTAASGVALFRFNRDTSVMFYKLAVFNIDDVVASHIHCSPAGVNGPVGVTLFSGGPVTLNGLLAKARVTAPDPGNACGWETLEDVVAALQSGNGYVNVHTLAHPPGEIRGQIH